MSPRRLLSVTIGAGAAVVCWLAFAGIRDLLPVWLRFAIAGTVLVFGPGAALAGRLSWAGAEWSFFSARGRPRGARLLAPHSLITRVVLAFSFGTALVPPL